jgi:subtilisin family serine protease
VPVRRARRRLSLAAIVAVAAIAGTLVPATAAQADSIRSREYWLDEYGIRAAWATTRGAGQTIAIIDSGIGQHPDLAGAVAGGKDFSGIGSADGRTPVGSEQEHGTLVASVAAGRGTGTDGGVIGAAPEAKLLSASIGFEQGTTPSDDQIANAVKWSVDQGATVINLSLGRNTPDWPTSWDDAFGYAEDHDVVIVASAGNRGSGTDVVGAPATMPGVLTVAGLDRNGTASQDASSQGITIGVSAPSEDLVGDLPGGGFALWAGTSGAAPIVAGIVALVRAAHPGLDAANVIQRVLATARDAGAPGTDVLYGYGKVDAAAAVTATVPKVSANPLGSLKDWIALYRPAAAATPAPGSGSTAAPAPTAAPRIRAGGIGLPEVQAIGLPLAVTAGLLAVWLTLGVAAVAAVRRARRTR